MFPEIHYSQNFSPSSGWMGPKFGQKMTTHFIFPNYNLDHQIPWGVDRGTAGSVNFDGPSIPSQNCFSSCTSTTHPIGLVLVHTSPNNTPLRCLNEVCGNDSGVPQNGRERPQKGITAGFSLELGHYRLCKGAVTLWEPFESEYFLIFGHFSGISWASLTSVSPLTSGLPSWAILCKIT